LDNSFCLDRKRNAEKDLNKRLKLQQEEFEMSLSRHQTFVDQLISEKRGLQDKCEKLFHQCKDTEEKYQERLKSMQTKHLEEIRRIRKMQASAETAKKQKWLGSKTQEIKVRSNYVTPFCNTRIHL